MATAAPPAKPAWLRPVPPVPDPAAWLAELITAAAPPLAATLADIAGRPVTVAAAPAAVTTDPVLEAAVTGDDGSVLFRLVLPLAGVRLIADLGLGAPAPEAADGAGPDGFDRLAAAALAEAVALSLAPGLTATVGEVDGPDACTLGLAVEAGGSAFAVAVAVPQAGLAAATARFAPPDAAAIAPARPGWQGRLRREIDRTRVTVEAIVEESELSLARLAALEVGDVIAFAAGLGSEIRLDTGGVPLLSGVLGQRDGRYTLTVSAFADRAGVPDAGHRR